MFSIPHMIVLFVVVLVVFGPHKLPELARGLGKLMAEFRKASTDFKLAFEEEMRNVERQAREAERKKQQDAATASAATEETASATPADVGTPPQLPEAIEPVVTPVAEAVARGAEKEAPTEELDAAAPETTPAQQGSEEDTPEKALHDHGHHA